MTKYRATHEEIRVMFEEEKLSDLEIGQRIGLKEESASRLRLRHGFIREPNGRSRNRIPDALLKECEAMLDEGYSYRAIEGMKGVAQASLARHFPGRGFTRQQTNELMSMNRRLKEIR